MKLSTILLSATAMTLLHTPVNAQMCSDPSLDEDGDGYGFENGETCIAFLPGLSPPLVSIGIQRICIEDTDVDGDGWGWEQDASCVVLERLDNDDSETASIDRDDTGFPVCQSTDSDPDGDGFGYENRRSCRVGAEVASTTTGSATEITIDSTTVVALVASEDLSLQLIDDTPQIDQSDTTAEGNQDDVAENTVGTEDIVEEEQPTTETDTESPVEPTTEETELVILDTPSTTPSDNDLTDNTTNPVIEDNSDTVDSDITEVEITDDTDALAEPLIEPDPTDSRAETEETPNDDSTSIVEPQSGTEVDPATNDDDTQEPSALLTDEDLIRLEEDEDPEPEITDTIQASLAAYIPTIPEFRICDPNESVQAGPFTLSNNSNISDNEFDVSEVQCMESTAEAVRWRYNYPLQLSEGEYGYPNASISIDSKLSEAASLKYEYYAIIDDHLDITIKASMTNDCGSLNTDHELVFWLTGQPELDTPISAVSVANQRWNAHKGLNTTHLFNSNSADPTSGSLDLSAYAATLLESEVISSTGCINNIEFGTKIKKGFGFIEVNQFQLN